MWFFKQGQGAPLDDLSRYIGQAVGRKSMNAIIRTKRKLETYFQPLDLKSASLTFKLNDLGSDIAYDILTTDPLNTLDFEVIFHEHD